MINILGSLLNLQHLSMCHGFIGIIPPELGNLTNLKTLNLANSRLIGSIPKELGNLSKLEKLYLYNNQLTGKIPQELGNLTNLYELYFLTSTLKKSQFYIYFIFSILRILLHPKWVKR